MSFHQNSHNLSSLAPPHETTTITATDAPDHCGCNDKRNLVVCIDGTANQFGLKNTNVVELYNRLEKNATQLTYYNSGIGTYAKESWMSPKYMKQVFGHKVDMAIAWNFKRIVLSAYQWLSENYEDGGRIFLFGFSRGAYQVRVIAGMIEKVGLLYKGNNDQIAFAYELYTSSTTSTKRSVPGTEGLQRKKSQSNQEDLCKYFKDTLSRPHVKVHFVGAWDTVSSIGIVKGPSLPETTTGMKHVCAFRHALALDERRVKFLPEYANGGVGPSSEGNIREVWFAGSHSDIGGGNTENLKSDHFGPALRWMSHQAIDCGLKMQPHRGDFKSMKPRESLTGLWKLLEVLPIRRLSYEGKNNTTHWPHYGRTRQVQPGQKIHESVIDLKGRKSSGYYEPKAHIPNQVSWESKIGVKKEMHNMIEEDVYTSLTTILSDYRPRSNVNETHLDKGLQELVKFPGAFDLLFHFLQAEYEKKMGQRKHIMTSLMTALAAFTQPPQNAETYPKAKLRELICKMDDQTTEVQNDIRKILDTFCGPTVLEGHKQPVHSVSFWQNSTHVVSGSRDGFIQVWDVETGKKVKKLDGHMFVLLKGDTRILCCSENMEIRVWDKKVDHVDTWDSHTGTVDPVNEPKGHLKSVLSVALSPDGTLIASASKDSSIGLWEVKDDEVNYLREVGKHAGPVYTVTFSPDGTQIASGSNDQTVRVWNTINNPTMSPLKGHMLAVWSVAFSSDGQWMVSSSNDKSVRVWDMSSTKMTVKRFWKHDTEVYAVACSSQQTCISGSKDGVIYFWDSQKENEVMQVHPKDEYGISSLAFSQDGESIAVGCQDGKVRVWDLKTLLFQKTPQPVSLADSNGTT
ncbi:WD40 repeat-like protein [Dendrothele bispora CBS 962.96]|uniref:WD40 repeat-like protein n=1 Tax=Dendrothele bispora (strain CBS 962.96) TaxID=1314807 RepID=A0A4S8MIY5_DENBC|nr:WD40 repeat-like protein [Dendrothele bispora CBS 962.96]